ncbi:Type IV pilus biogenesis factor PilY1 [Ralstonia mannitolilytica]|uniref:pilus assembly protein n=1 Tax=Ralstonia mannitolilytica TaxID=105219 RepID=UPI0028F64F76|nr:PilC/PilY family type IV pilus protein [Ralstonia mannitolilytica]CAJ0681034.1 Type IV pilus biogenesis factor PilY1 [Ralstonia mannitolilytica]CAJ0872771.1 Type IV pilus biogenesis factor PilY1 [Ralstonia mannitolilytica]
MTFLRGVLASVIALMALQAPAAPTDLADQPLFSSVSVPGNLLLTLSVEYPTANSIAYVGGYTAHTKYLGYFDPLKCYTYQYDANVDSNNYFVPAALADGNLQCQSGKNYWSGAFLNWATMQTIDPFRWALTGGYRVTDTPNLTVLEKAWASGQGGSSETPNRTVSNSISGSNTVAAITPFNWSSFSVRIYGAGNKLYFTRTGNLDSDTPRTYTSGSSQDSSKVWWVYARVKVCDPSQPEANCTKYGSNYKPEGLMQQYSQRIRFGAFGYLNDSSIMRDGGVLRARMKFIGPTQPVPGKNPTTNTLAEWSATDGTMVTNPDTADASATGVSNSGVMNYLNKFGSSSKNYKTYDPVGELYYAGIRYYKNLGNVASYSSNINATQVDGFPVIQKWDDPIQYSCQKNFILGIGDVNTHADANLPGSTIANAQYEPAMPSEVSSDTTVNVDSATNLVGKMEGISNLNKASPSWCCGDNNTFLMAGLAYDSHVRDIRPNDFKDGLGNKSTIQTISTYWLDVQEYQQYKYQNQFWLAAKYGGFTVPSNYNASSTTPLAQSLWSTGKNNGSDSNLDPNSKPMPDNYFLAGQADLMVNGLNAAFQDMSNSIQAATTALAVSSANVSLNGNIGYSASYNSANWTGNVIGSALSFEPTTGLPTQKQAWSAQTQLAGQSSSSRLIATSNSPGAAQGVPFRLASLNASNQSALSNSAVKNWNNQDFLNYLRGDRTNEGANGKAVYRARAFLLGDIVGSKVDAVGPPTAVLSSATNPGYASFKSSYANRKPVVYVGANDGMMHAFDGTIGNPTSGNELFAYVPSFLYQGPCMSGCTPTVNGLASLGLAGTNFVHHAMVDATPQAFDVDFARAGGAKPSSSTTSDWHTILIGGLGKGGKGYYALDVTDPSAITDETSLSSKVMWEFGGPSDPKLGTLGFTYGDPIVVKTKKYGWVVAVPSGYNNADGMGWLFILNPANGALLESISTGVGSTSTPAGLAYISAYVADYTDNTTDSIYAGDLLGNVWRFDLTGTTGAYPAPTQIAKLTDPSGNPQPVTTPPLIEIQPNSLKRYVMVGTGRLLGSTDIASSQTQSFYVIYDGVVQRFNSSTDLPTGVTFPIQRKNLNANTNLLKGIGSAPTSVMGYYIDLSQSSNGVAERVNVAPVSNFGTVSFAANLPNGDACNPSGTNRVFSLDIGTGASRVVNSLGVLQPYYTGGGLVVDLSYLNVNGTVRLEAGTDNSAINSVPLVPTVVQAIRQINWREVPTAD